MHLKSIDLQLSKLNKKIYVKETMEKILPKETKHLVFVYGTLKRNEPNHKFWSVATFVGDDPNQIKKGQFHLLARGETSRKLPLVIATKHNVRV